MHACDGDEQSRAALGSVADLVKRLSNLKLSLAEIERLAQEPPTVRREQGCLTAMARLFAKD